MLSWEHFGERLAASKHLSEDQLLFDYNGVLYPSMLCCKETFQQIKTFEARKDDILLASYPKSGTIWSIQLMNDMIHTTYNKSKHDHIPHLELMSPDHIEDVINMPSPRFLATHLQADNTPKSFFKNKAKILVVFRNPKDTAVSCYHFYKNIPVLPTVESWDDFFQLYLKGEVFFGSYFDFAVGWNKHADDENVLIITYEEMKKDLAAVLRKISTHFGFALTDEQVNVVASTSKFKNMKEKSQETHSEFGQAFFRKGDIGDWRNYFSEAQNQAMDAKFEKLLSGTKVGEKINYNVYCK
ncbi:sulfotransferase 6B1-like [Discoglossus pictus]